MLIIIKIVFTTLFWSAGIFGIFNFSEVVKEVQAVNLPLPSFFAVATIATQLGGSVLVITNIGELAWIGAIGLAIFTLLTIPFGHAFWTFPEPQKTAEMHIALEHITVAGGLFLAAWWFRISQ